MRKKSGSIEGVSPTSSGPNLISALSSSVTAAAGGGGGGIDHSTAPVGTWKLIKGKVSQTIEEIKSSKHHTQHAAHIPVIVAEPSSSISTVGWSNEADSDSECITINTAVGEEHSLPIEKQQTPQNNSDSDPEIELLDTSSLGSGDICAAAAISTERSRLRRGIAHIKSKVKAKQQAAAMSKKDQGSGASAPISVRGSFLRRRNNVDNAAIEPSTSGQAEARQIHESASAPEIAVDNGKAKRGVVLARKDVEIESGVEVLEDMVPTTSGMSDEPMLPSGVHFNESIDERQRNTLNLQLATDASDTDLRTDPSRIANTNHSLYSLWSTLSTASFSNWHVSDAAQPLLLLGCVILLPILPVSDFMRGVIATVLFIVTLNYFSCYISFFFEHFVLGTHPERSQFKIPSYDSICEIPAVEEHKNIKTYAGWLNEIDSYDPSTFSFNMTKAIYVRLDGAILKISSTNARIPKRRMWNEKPIDRAKVLFVDHRSYDLRDARIELLPVGLARKRFFNRKYPIQLIIKKSVSGFVTPFDDLDRADATPVTAAGTPTQSEETLKPIDFGVAVMSSDLRRLHNIIPPDKDLKDMSMPCGDEVRLLIFARCDREKEDWYRRFNAASRGCVHESDLQVPIAQFVEDTDFQAAAAQQAINLTSRSGSKTQLRDGEEPYNDETGSNTPDTPEDMLEEEPPSEQPKEGYEGLLMSADVARNPAGYIKFMTVYQKACKQDQIPVFRNTRIDERKDAEYRKKTRRARRQEHELWKGIDQSLFLGPSGSVVWANVLMGRGLFSLLHNAEVQLKIQDFMQKKLNSIKLPSFMEEVVITNINLGMAPMLCHRISQPMLDERGIWLDADVTYEGLAHITVTTKLNLLRVRSKPKPPAGAADIAGTSQDQMADARGTADDIYADGSNSIFDSDAESTGGSSSESETTPPTGTVEPTNNAEFFQNSPGNARRIFKIVDRIATSNLFQYATELPYVQRAMENMSANITLRVELKGMVARGTLNIPPPPSDRIWLCFRGPPRLWISTKPQVGDKSVDWTIVTNVIESKLCEAVNKFLVYPNMVDFSIPFLAKPSYGEDPAADSA